MWLLSNAGINFNPSNLICVILARTHTNQSSGSWIMSLYKNISGIPEHLDLTGLHDYFPFAYPKVKSFIRRAFDHNHVLVATEGIHPGKWHQYGIRKWLMHYYRLRLIYIYTYINIYFRTTLFHHIYISLWPQDKTVHISKAQRILKYEKLTA